MSMYHALYEKVSNELKELEERLKELDLKRLSIKDDYEMSEENLWEQEDILSNLESKRDDIPYKNRFVISIYAGILALVCVIFVFSLYFNGLIKTLLLFPTLSEGVQALILLFSSILGLLGCGLSSSVLADKIQKKLEKKSIKKIINSKEYQELLSKINILVNELDTIRKTTIEKEKTYKKANEEYEKCKKERDEKKLLVEYISKQMTPTENTLHMVKEYKREYCGDNSCSCF